MADSVPSCERRFTSTLMQQTEKNMYKKQTKSHQVANRFRHNVKTCTCGADRALFVSCVKTERKQLYSKQF